MARGRYRLREGVEIEGRTLRSERPLVATRVNDAARDLVAELDGESFRSVERVADAAGVEPRQAASLFESLRQRGLLAFAPESDSEHRPPVSVVVTVRNEADAIGSCLDALAALAYPDYEVVVVDDGSTDGTAAAVRSHPLAAAGDLRLVTVDDPPLGIGACRNRGVAAAAHDVIAFTDADCRPRPEWLTDLVPRLAAHDLVGGRVRPHGEGRVSAFEGVQASLDMGPRAAPVARATGTPYLATANLVGRREVFEAVPFPERNVAEDVDVCWRAREAGYDVVYAADGVVEHDYGDARRIASRRLAYGESEALLASEYGHPESVSVPAAPLVAVAVLAVGLAVGPVVGLSAFAAAVPAVVGASVAAAAGTTGRTVAAAVGSDGWLGLRSAVDGLARGVLSRLYAVSSEVSRYYSLPAAVAVATLAAAGFGTAAAAGLCLLVVALCLPPLVDAATGPVSPSLATFLLLGVLADLSYQVGTYRGALRYCSAVHLDPRRRFAIAV